MLWIEIIPRKFKIASVPDPDPLFFGPPGSELIICEDSYIQKQKIYEKKYSIVTSIELVKFK